jgi:uncharacterized membrane protein AbrB (regulator of aidB expression)
MNTKALLITCTVSIIVAILTTALLRNFGVEETAGIAGGVAGAISAVVAMQFATKKDEGTDGADGTE